MNDTITKITYESLMRRISELKGHLDLSIVAERLSMNVQTVRRAFRGEIKNVATLRGIHDTANEVYSQTVPKAI